VPLFINVLEEVFSETASEFLCEGVLRCLLLRCATGAKGHLAPVLTHKDARGWIGVSENSRSETVWKFGTGRIVESHERLREEPLGEACCVRSPSNSGIIPTKVPYLCSSLGPAADAGPTRSAVRLSHRLNQYLPALPASPTPALVLARCAVRLLREMTPYCKVRTMLGHS
jgi:hypothetical protein